MQSGAWAAKLIQEAYRDIHRRRDEQFIENALTFWLDSKSNRRGVFSQIFTLTSSTAISFSLRSSTEKTPMLPGSI